MRSSEFEWWAAENDRKKASAVCAVIRRIQGTASETSRQQMAIQNCRLYGETNLLGYAANDTKPHTRVSMNLIRSVVTSVVARIVKNKPRPVFQTTGGNRSLKRKSQNLTHYVDYAMEGGDAKRAYQLAFRDAAITGDGFVHVYNKGEETRFERIFPSEVLVSPQEGLYGVPRTLYRKKWIPRNTLLDMYPDNEYEIHNAEGPPLEEDQGLMLERDDLVVVYEAWRLPDMKGGNGEHVIVTSKGLLAKEPWKHDSFPIIHIQYDPNMQGYYSTGIAENLTGIHVELNRNLSKRQAILKLLAVPRVFVQDKNVKQAKLNNMIGGVYHGAPPVFYSPPTLPPELNDYIEGLWVKGHLLEGISPSESAGSLPNGVTAAVAMREYDTIVDGKFALVHQAYQDAWMEGARWAVRLGAEIYKKNPKWSPVASKDRHTVATVKWSEINMNKDEYVVRMMPASSLPTHPGAKKQEVYDMLQNGIIDAVEAKRLIDITDLEDYRSLDRALTDYLEWVAEQILDEGKYISPEPFQDSGLALKRMQAVYHRAVMREVPEDRLQMIRDYMSSVRDDEKAQMAEQAQMMAPAATGAPPPTGPDGAPPTALGADLLQ